MEAPPYQVLISVSILIFMGGLIQDISGKDESFLRKPNPDPCMSSHAMNYRPRFKNVSIREFGGVGDGVFMNTGAFEKAIAYLSRFGEKGGGQLNIPKGRWLTASFNLTSHLTLFLEKGAVILGSQNFEDWPVIEALPSYGRGRELPGGRHISLIHGANLTDVVITGDNGTIDGQGHVWWAAFRNKTLDHTRGHLLELVNSSNIIITNLTFQNSPFWTIHPVYCRNIYMQNLTILAPTSSPNTDGIDPDSSSDVCIEDCYINTGDDAVSVKSGWNEFGYKYGMPSNNIVVRNIVGRTRNSAGFSIGSEMSGGVSNVFVENIAIINAYAGVRIKTSPGRGGYVRDIYISNITIERAKVGILVSSIYGEHPHNNWDPSALSSLGKLVISGMVGLNVTSAGRIQALPSHNTNTNFNDIHLNNIWMSTSVRLSKAWKCNFVRGSSKNVFPKPCPEMRMLV